VFSGSSYSHYCIVIVVDVAALQQTLCLRTGGLTGRNHSCDMLDSHILWEQNGKCSVYVCHLDIEEKMVYILIGLSNVSMEPIKTAVY